MNRQVLRLSLAMLALATVAVGHEEQVPRDSVVVPDAPVASALDSVHPAQQLDTIGLPDSSGSAIESIQLTTAISPPVLPCPSCDALSWSDQGAAQRFLVAKNYMLPEAKGLVLASDDMLYGQYSTGRFGVFAVSAGPALRPRSCIGRVSYFDSLSYVLEQDAEAALGLDSIPYLSGG